MHPLRNLLLLFTLAVLAAPALALREVTPDGRPVIEVPLPADLADLYADLPFGRTDDGYPYLGDPAAPVVIHDFASYSCPSCLSFYQNVFLALLEDIRAGQVQFIYVPVNTGSIPNGEAANRAALCAAEQERFWVYSSALYHWHDTYANSAFEPERLAQGATLLGLAPADWQACLDSTRPDDVLQSARQLMEHAGIQGTPSILVNLEPVMPTLEAIREQIDRLRRNRT
ncbi:MAG: DsbA family protein [Anaerolineae bacterium]|jgi:protein-disulfide isomerase|nr:DsbA family protein [Anaerolineae bacterium]